MKTIAFVLSALIILSAAFAETYTATYSAGDWLQVTRTVKVEELSPCFDNAVSNTCINTGSINPVGGTATRATFTITAKNIGPVDRKGVELTESLSHIPEGAKLKFSSVPSAYDGRQATWVLSSLPSGGEATVSYSTNTPITAGAVQRIPDITLRAPPADISLSAPTSSKVGEQVSITVKSASGKPVANTVIYVVYSDGSRQAVRTNGDGVAKFTARQEGFYTYSADGYAITNMASTDVKPAKDAIPLVAATAASDDKGLTGSLLGVLPILAAIFAIAVIALIVYNFAAGKREEEEQEQAQASAPQPQEAAPAYSQKFSFADEAKQETKMREMSHDILASRKKRLRESISEKAEDETGEAANYGETTDEVGSELAALEAKAEKEGEAAEVDDDAEIEKTIAQLEAIREKLRARKMAAAEEEAGQGEEGGAQDMEPGEAVNEEEAPDEAIVEQEIPRAAPRKIVSSAKPISRKPVYEKPASRKAAAKPKRMKFGTRGVKKK